MFNDDDVGYGKPPKDGQFQKGQSGNPKGRPKSKPLQLSIIDALNRVVAIKQNGSTENVFVKDAILLQLCADALKGKPHAVKAWIEILKNFTALPDI